MELYCTLPKVLKQPSLGYHPFLCDFGHGFYCAESQEASMEMAPLGETHGYCCRYELDTAGLAALDLSRDGCNPLHWVAMLIQNRQFNLKLPVAQAAADYLLRHFLPDTSGIDVIRGYRADGVYFSFARDFLNNAITLRQLKTALECGELGKEMVVRSERAVSRLRFVEAIPVTEPELHNRRRREREESAKRAYLELGGAGREDLFIVDIMKGGGGQWLQSHIQKSS